ncbi:hypothetical protein EIP91_002290 [Steccherinum ochraceum]|uniref:BRCT domain-containing protein n=1 Tax=Steccherinum ochraceum TaxID=92696 RepID=A0A4R0RT61_9APHY|nr:hypothetical protein EIP91_002290 [Steccherinum ochraceum]
MAQLFDGVRYALSSTLDQDEKDRLSSLLDQNGATPFFPSNQRLTHYITVSLPTNQPIDELPVESDAHVVTPFWVDRSAVLAAIQDESGFSPDPSLIFSGVCAAACELTDADVDLLSAGITALGGQWRSALTKEVTHLFAVSTDGGKYQTGLHFKEDIGLRLLVPHWFDDCVRFGRNVDTEAYEWPEPRVFEVGFAKEGGERSRSRSPQKLTAEKQAFYASIMQTGPPPKPKSVWNGLKIMLSLEMTESQMTAHEADIEREGGVVVDDVDEADVVIMRYRSGPIFVKAYRANKTIGTPAWLWFVRSTGKKSRPTDQLLHYPIPSRSIEGFSAHRITITNYTGQDREYLKKLILILGAEFTADMTGNNTVVVAATRDGKKTQKADSWSIPVVNHLWLEDCFVQWRHLAQTPDRYTDYPPGLDFSKLLTQRSLVKVGYDPSDLDLIQKEVEAEERGEPMGTNPILSFLATGQSAKEVEDVVMADDGADQDLQMDVDDEPTTTAKKTRAKPTPKPKSTSRKPASRTALPQDDDEVESETPAVKTRSKRASMAGKKGGRRAVESEDEDVSPTKKRVSPRKRALADEHEGGEEDEQPKPLKKPAIKRTYGSSSRAPPPEPEETDREGTPPAVSPSKTSLHTPKRTVSVLVPTYEQVKSASKSSLGRDAEPPVSPKRGRKSLDESKPGPSSRSPVSSLSPPPSPQRTRKTSSTRHPATPAGPSHVVATPVTLGRSPSKRSAATRATQKLREEVMPDVLNFQKELKRGNVRSTWDHEQQASAKKAKESAKGKKRVSMGDGDEEEEQQEEQEEQPDRKRRRSSNGAAVKQGKGKGRAPTVSDDEDEENDGSVAGRPAKSSKADAKATTATGKNSGRISKKDPASIKIMTTQVILAEDVTKAMIKLGVSFTTKASECTHLVARSIVRTEKFLCAMAAGPIIVTDKWIQTCVKTKHILVEDDFLLKDPESEKKYNFVLTEALERARESEGKLFAGMTFVITPKIPIDTKLLKSVVTASGGQIHLHATPTYRALKNNTNKLVVSCPADITIWRNLLEQGIPVYSQELILNSALTQEIDRDNPLYQNKLDALFTVPAPAPRASLLTPSRLAGPTQKAAKELIELMQDNHKKLHIFFNDKQFHNHSTHHLLAIYSMGADADLLKDAYSTHVAYQRPAIPPPGPITKENWKDHLDDERYYQSYLTFFSDLLLANGPTSILEEYILSKDANVVPGKEKEPPQMLGRYLGGFLHPLIHSGYGAEFGQLGMWAEGLSEACVQTSLPRDILPDALFDNLAPSTPSLISRVASLTLSSRAGAGDGGVHALSILGRVVKDPAFSRTAVGLPAPADENAVARVVAVCKDKLLKFFEEWTVGHTREDLDKKFEEVMWMNAVIYGVGGWSDRAHSKDPSKEFNGDFFLMHLVTSSLFLPSVMSYLPPATAAFLLRTYFLTTLVLYIARGRPALPIADFYSAVTDAPKPPGPQPTPSQGVFGPDQQYTNPPVAKKNWIDEGGPKIITPNPWLAIIQSTLTHPDEHLCKAQRSLLHYASMFGATAPGAFSTLKGDLDGAEHLDGTIFIRIAGLTQNRLGWVREGEDEKSWDNHGFFEA